MGKMEKRSVSTGKSQRKRPFYEKERHKKIKNKKREKESLL